jgi:hypothetical protein
MPVCPNDPSHRMSEWWRRNELGRWYRCETCGAARLSPAPRYRLLLLALRLARITSRLTRRAVAKRPPRILLGSLIVSLSVGARSLLGRRAGRRSGARRLRPRGRPRASTDKDT